MLQQQKMSRTAIDAMSPHMETHYGNPSSLTGWGRRPPKPYRAPGRPWPPVWAAHPGRSPLPPAAARPTIRLLISAARIGERKGKKHIISTAFEHHAILHTLKKLEKEGFEVELPPVAPLAPSLPSR